MVMTGWVVKAAPAVAPAGCVVRASWLAAPGETVKGLESTAVRAPSVKWSVLAPAVSMRRLVKLTTPATAATVTVPWSEPLPLAIVTVTLELLAVAVLPYASSPRAQAASRRRRRRSHGGLRRQRELAGGGEL